MRETTIQAQIRLAILRDGRAFVTRNNTGECPSTHVVYGLGKGGADLVGMLRGSGRVFTIEVKTPTRSLTREQRLWLGAVRARGGFAGVARSVPEALACVDRACAGASE